jgi:hypothetical protein
MPSAGHTQSVYLFSGRAVTPDKKPIVSMKKNSSSYGRASGASTDRTHNLNRNSSLTAISVSGGATHSRNINRTRDLKSKGSISSNSSYQHTSTGKMSTSKTYRQKSGEETDKEMKLTETVKVLKSENKKLMSLIKESEKTWTDKLKDSRKEMEKMTTIINQLWPFIQSHLKRELGSQKIASLKKMAKEESRIDFLDTLSKVIAKVKKDAELEGRSLFGTDSDAKYEKLRKEHSRFEQMERDMKLQLKEKHDNEMRAKE